MERRRVLFIPDECTLESAPQSELEGGELSQPLTHSEEGEVSRWRVDRQAALEALRQRLSIDVKLPMEVGQVQPQTGSLQVEELRPVQRLPDSYRGVAGTLLQEIEIFAEQLGLPDSGRDRASFPAKVEELHRRLMLVQPNAITELCDRIEYTRRAAEQWRSDRETIAKTIGVRNETMKEIVTLTNFLQDEVEPSLQMILDTSEELNVFAPLYAEALRRSSQLERLANPLLASDMKKRLSRVENRTKELMDAILSSKESLRDSADALRERRKQLAQRTNSGT
jgi:hypothetical protein